jgi:hypothetical protein
MEYINSIINQENIDKGRLELVEEIFNSIESSKHFNDFNKIYTDSKSNTDTDIDTIAFINFKSNVNYILQHIISKNDDMIPVDIIQNIKQLNNSNDIKSFILQIKYIILYMIYIITTKKYKNENYIIENTMFVSYSINRPLIGFCFLLLGEKQFFNKFFSHQDIKSKKEKVSVDNLINAFDSISIKKELNNDVVNNDINTNNYNKINNNIVDFNITEKELIKTYLFNYMYNFDDIKYLSNMSIFVNSIYRPTCDAMPTYHDNIQEYFYDLIRTFNYMKNVFIF